LSNPDSLLGGVKATDVIIHTAASREPDGMKWERECVTAMLDAIAGSGKVFIYTSGISVVGDTGDSIRDETHPINADNPRGQLETLIHGYTQRDVRTIMIRPSFVYGRRGGILPRYLDHAKAKDVAGYVLPGDNRWSFVHVDDLATLYRLAAEKAPAGAVYNAVNPEPLPMRAISEAIAEHTGATLTAWTPQEAAPIVGGIAYAFTMNVAVSAQKAMDDLGWRPEQPGVLEEISSAHGQL
jgi:nucleoside-diphosphate-sugar epimerase